MKLALLIIFFSISAFAQQVHSALPASCGPENVTFNVTRDSEAAMPTQDGVSKAKVYFIQDDGPSGDHQHYVVRIALDGAWVGAYKNNSYFDVPVGPGEHHVCANVQSEPFGRLVLLSASGRLVRLAHFHAEAGKSYYFQTQFLDGITLYHPIAPYLNLSWVDSDEGKYLVDTLPLSVWKVSK